MKLLIKLGIFGIIALVVIGGISAAVYQYLQQRNKTHWRTVKVSQGDIIEVVNSTGTVKPVKSVSVGAVVSGPIDEIKVEFNEEVKKDQLLAKIDERLFTAIVAREEAALATRKADLKRVEALLQQAKNDEKRVLSLQNVNAEFISQSELDQYKFSVISLEAQIEVANAAIKQAEASLANAEANLSFTEIISPIDGIVIDRKIDPGQSLASSFQTPELFIVAPDLRKEVHVFANVDEADIGLIIAAKERDEPVHFTVDAYPEELFEGRIAEVRYSSTELQNVVTYPVVVTTENPDLKLLPGMTATISFQIEKKESILRIPNAALRFYPDAEKVHPDDRDILEGRYDNSNKDQDSSDISAIDKAQAGAERRRRHVWVVEGEFVRAVEVVTGVTDNKFSELVSGDLRADQELVTGIDTNPGK